jgi:Helicase conserved C-terminal domain
MNPFHLLTANPRRKEPCQITSFSTSTAAVDVIRKKKKPRKQKPVPERKHAEAERLKQVMSPNHSASPLLIEKSSIKTKRARERPKKKRPPPKEINITAALNDFKAILAKSAVDETSNKAYAALPPKLPPNNRARRNASQFIPMWLRREHSWRVAVLELLKLPTNFDSANNSRRNLSAALQGDFYHDSIPSFTEALKRGPPESLYAPLDILVKAGLSENVTAEKYRTTKRLRLQHKDFIAAMTEKQSQLDYHQKFYNIAAKDVQALNERLAALPSPTDKSSSLWDRTVNSMSSLFQSEQQRNEAALKEAAVAKQRSNLLKIIGEKEHGLWRHQSAMDAINVKLAMMKDELASPPLTDEEFAFIETAASSAMPAIAKAFADHIRDRHSQILEQYQTLDAKTDLTRPHDWFLHARLDRRKIIFHGGPTNSGKTYTALERLKKAGKGLYLGPLRLLAAEVYEKLTADGVYCNLYTGQERREIPFATHGAATVEMAVMTEEYDVIVIDEIQMINDWQRGFAWTRALLGSRCKEIHVCGGMEAVNVVRRIAEACGDEFEVCTYKRFSELQIAASSLSSQVDQVGSYKHVQAGDAIVAFSRDDIFAIKREIETNTEHKCCVIYGSLPPSTRSEQARRFNDPDSGYDILVASDAIGMGLNLNIRRIIFNSVFKNDGTGIVRLDHSAVKQISGRAGRRNSPFPVGGKPDGRRSIYPIGTTWLHRLTYMNLYPLSCFLRGNDTRSKGHGIPSPLPLDRN